MLSVWIPEFFKSFRIEQTTNEMINSPKDFQSRFSVSRESVERLEIYHEQLLKWQNIQNLVAPSTLDEVWHRHFADSAQLVPFVGEPKTIIDLGAGAGFPGLVLAILLAEREDLSVHLVESNGRKCGFMREVVRQAGISAKDRAAGACGVSVEIHNARIEEFSESNQAFNADLITARALASLSSLLTLAKPFFSTDSKALFLKGQDLEAEIDDARGVHQFDHQIHLSQTDRTGRIIEISRLGR